MERQSKTGLKLIKSSQYVEDSVEANASEIGPVLDEKFLAQVAAWKAAQAGKGKVLAPTFSGTMLILRDGLAVSRERLAKADRTHVKNLRHFLDVRDAARRQNGTVYAKMSATRRTFEDHFPEAVNAFVLAGFESPTAQENTRLLQQADLALEGLESPDLVLPKSLMKGIEVKPKVLVAELESEVEKLRVAYADLRLARREVQKSRKNRNRAVEEHKVLFLWTARTFESFYRLAGEPELAAQIRPSGVRRGRRAVEVAEGAEMRSIRLRGHDREICGDRGRRACALLSSGWKTARKAGPPLY